MIDRSLQKAQSIFKNDIKNFIYQSLEELNASFYNDNDFFNSGYEAAMDEILNFLDIYDEQKEEK